MGREGKSITVIATVSRHNSEQDREDDADWDHLVSRIEEIVHEDIYSDIHAMVV